MSIATITIGSVDYTSYASLVEANAELAIDPQRRTAWNAITDDDEKARYLVAATRRLDIERWRGQKAGGASQNNAWPRSGLKYEDGTDVPGDQVPHDIERATILLAGTIAGDAGQADVGQQTNAIKRVKAGPTEVEFSETQAPPQRAIRDQTVHELIAPWLESALAGSVGATYGTEEQSGFEKYERTQGFS